MTSRDDQLLISGRLMTINAINLVPGPTASRRSPPRVSATTYIVPATEGADRRRNSSRPRDGPHDAGPDPSGSSTGAPAAAITSVIR